MTLDELIEQKRKEKVKEELGSIVSKKLESKQKSTDTSTNSGTSSRRKAYNASESTKAITNNTSNSKVNLPVAQEFKQQLETGKRVQPTQEYSLPTFVNNVKKNALPVASKVVANIATNKTKEIGNDVSNIIGNVGYGVGNGLISLQQTFNRNAQKQQERDKQLFDDINKRAGLPTVDEMNKKTLRENKKEPIIDLEKQKQVNNQKIQENIETSSKGVGKKLSELAPTVGQMLPGMVSGGAGTLYFAGSAKGNYYDEAIQRGMSEEEADRYSGVMALLEAGGETVGANLTKAVGKNIAKGGLKQAGKMFALDVAENVAEEAVMEPLSELTATAVAGKEYANWNDIGKRMLEAGIDGGLVGMIMGGASAGIGSAVNVANKISKGQTVTQNELNTVEQDVNNRLTDKQVQQKLQEAQNIIDNVQNELVNTQTQQTTSQGNKTTQNQTSEQINSVENKKTDVGKIKIKEEVTNSYAGEIFLTKTAQINGKDVGKIEYSVYNNRPSIKMIEVMPEYRRQGIATKLLQNLQEEYKNVEIDFGMTTDDGTKFLNSVTYKMPNKEIQKKKQRIDEITNILSEYEIKSTNGTLTEAEGENWNKLYDEKRRLEDDIWNKNEFETFVKLNSIENNQQTLYNNNESESGINGKQSEFTNQGEENINQRRIWRDNETMRRQEQGRSTGNITNTQGKDISSGVRQSSISKKQTIEEAYNDTVAIRETIDYANKNKLTMGTEEILQVQNRAKELGINIITYKGKEGNKHLGLLEKNNVYLDLNPNNISEEDGSVMNRFSHEVLHYIKRNTSFSDTINELQTDIINNHQESINKFIQDKGYDANSIPDTIKSAITEEILGDYSAKHISGYNIDYGLPENIVYALNTTIDDGITELKLNNSNQIQEIKEKRLKTLNPTEIANLTPEQANTTPNLPTRKYARGNKESSFLSNITTDAGFLNEDLRQEMAKEDNIRYYKGITNAETLEKAYNELQNGGEAETFKWFNKNNKNTKAEDVAKGWILLKQYQDSGDYQGAVEVAKKMRDMATNAGQTVQAYNILSRLTPEGMFYYAQSELSEAYNKMAEGKSKDWIDKNKSKFDLTPEETQLIKDKMESIQGIEDERTKKVTLGEIQKIITNKIPPTTSQSVKTWMRISMLFNPKTQVRNVMGNAVILPVNMTSDFISSGVDKIISKKTGVRTTGNTNIKSYAKGLGKGLYESYDDFRRGINTRSIEGNRFEVSEGKNFKDKGLGKVLNKVDNFLSFMLDAGDRGFYEATFTNSINNQLVLNNATEVTQDMIDIATNEALQRTWQDNNAYTNSVLKIRKILNFGKGYGLGDILIPFAKTPANLTKAIVDYSPVGLTKTLAIDARKFKNSLENEQYTPQLQHQFVQNLGKGMAGSFLYVLGYALAKAGIATGEADDDKDVKNFMKNSLGISSYSLKIGDKTFTYDWAQPVATPLAIMTNYVKYSKDNPDANAIEKAWKSMNIGTEQLLQQSFMESLNTVLNGSGTTLENLSQAVLELPSRAIPTLSKQVADMVDSTQRTSFEYGKPIESAINSVKAKLPVVSRTLPASVDTLGNEIQKYGGDNGVWNVMFNPANTNKGELSKAGEEIYNIYMQTGDATIFPRTAPYYINSKGEKITMDSSQRSEFQKITGTYVEDALDGLLNNKDYKKLSNEKKAEVINKIVSDSYSKAKYDILKIDSKEYQKLRNTLKNVSTTSYYNYKFKTEDMKKDKEKIGVLVNSNYTSKEKQTLYESYIKSENDTEYPVIKTAGIDITQYLKYKQQEFTSDKKDDGTLTGKTVSKSKQKKVTEYLNSMKITGNQRLLLYAMQGYSTTSSQKKQLANYVQGLSMSKQDKLKLFNKFSGFTAYKNGKVTW